VERAGVHRRRRRSPDHCVHRRGDTIAVTADVSGHGFTGVSDFAFKMADGRIVLIRITA